MLRLLTVFRLRLRSLFQGKRVNRELERELQFHLDQEIDTNIREGLSREEAGRAAQRRLGADLHIKEDCRQKRGFTIVDGLATDVRIALRSLMHSRGYSVAALLTLALGIGLNAAMLSLVNAVLLKPLPYRDPGRLVSFWEEERTPGKKAARTVVAPANLPDYQNDTRGLLDLAAYDFTSANMTGGDTPERIPGLFVTANFFSVLGVQPQFGRTPSAAESRYGAQPVVIISDRLWRSRFHADPEILGKQISLDDRKHTIIGVLPPAFRPISQSGRERAEYYAPAAFSPELMASRGDHEVRVVGRLQGSASIEQARAALAACSTRLAHEYPNECGKLTAAIAPLREDLVRFFRRALMVLLGAAGMILLIATVNLANLTLVRSLSKHREIAVRVALGAARGRLIRGLLTESVLTAAIGCAGGLLLGWIFEKALRTLAPADIPRLDAGGMDWRVCAVAVALAVVVGLLFGMLPALRASRTQPGDALRSRGTAGGPGAAGWRAAFTTAEVAVSLVLLVGAGLMLRSFVSLLGVDLGFQVDHVLAMNISLPEVRYRTAEARWRFFDQVAGRIGALPGVQSVAFANRMPLRGGWGGGLETDANPGQNRDADFQAVSPGYFATLGIPLLRGRLLTGADADDRDPVAVVNQIFATDFLGGSEPLGRRFRRHANAPWITVVGVVGDIRRSGKADLLNPQVYLPAAQTAIYPVRLSDLAVRAEGDPRLLVNAIQREVWAVDKDQPVSNVKTIDEMVDESLAERRFQLTLLLSFAMLAAALALVGIYGVAAYAASQRTTELGIRLALGAQRSQLVALIARTALIPTAAGIAAGLLGASALSGYLKGLLFQVEPLDATTYCVVAVLLAFTAFAASLIPALRAARLDPARTLRWE